jgi:ankyrin repeat protein
LVLTRKAQKSPIVENEVLWTEERVSEWLKAQELPRSIEATDALHCAVLYGNLGVVDWLLSNRGSKTDVLNVMGMAPIHIAANLGRVDILERLLAYGADIEFETSPRYGKTALHCAVQESQLDFCVALLDHGANIHHRDANQMTVLHLINFFSPSVLIELLVRGGDMNAFDCLGSAPLHQACYYNRVQSAEILLSRGANIELRELYNQRTPLIHAAFQGTLEMVALLLDAGADIHAKDKNGWRALHAAASVGKASIVALLISKGAKRKKRDKNGNTAETLAKRNFPGDRTLLGSFY